MKLKPRSEGAATIGAAEIAENQQRAERLRERSKKISPITGELSLSARNAARILELQQRNLEITHSLTFCGDIAPFIRPTGPPPSGSLRGAAPTIAE